jgi:hypothetical protein
MTKTYTLTIDENGQQTLTDFTDHFDVVRAFNKAVRRKTVFSATVDAYDAETLRHIARTMHCENE